MQLKKFVYHLFYLKSNSTSKNEQSPHIFCPDFIHYSNEKSFAQLVLRSLGSSGCILLNFSTTTYPDEIRIGFMQYPTRLYILNPLRCYNWNNYGRHSRRCSSKKPVQSVVNTQQLTPNLAGSTWLWYICKIFSFGVVSIFHVFKFLSKCKYTANYFFMWILTYSCIWFLLLESALPGRNITDFEKYLHRSNRKISTSRKVSEWVNDWIKVSG